MAHPVAFEQIYKDYKNLVYNLCLHYVLNPEDAQDITQEVFVKIYQRSLALRYKSNKFN